MASSGKFQVSPFMGHADQRPGSFPPLVSIIAGPRISEMPSGRQIQMVASARGLGDDGSESRHLHFLVFSGEPW